MPSLQPFFHSVRRGVTRPALCVLPRSRSSGSRCRRGTPCARSLAFSGCPNGRLSSTLRFSALTAAVPPVIFTRFSILPGRPNAARDTAEDRVFLPPSRLFRDYSIHDRVCPILCKKFAGLLLQSAKKVLTVDFRSAIIQVKILLARFLCRRNGAPAMIVRSSLGFTYYYSFTSLR